MDVFKLMLMATAMAALVILNVQLAIFGESLKLYERTLANGALECFYYRPVEVFTLETDREQGCSLRIKTPNTRED